MFTVNGKLVYDPIRHDFKKTHKSRTLILELPKDDLDLYYQWFLERKYGQWLKIQRPMYGLHCTIIKGDEFISNEKIHIWNKHQGMQIQIELDESSLKSHWKFWSLEVKSPELEDLRKEFGLNIYHNFHVTIGRQYEWQYIIKG